MEVVGSEIGHKMRSAIKAKLTELGCYVDDELPDYVMVMVANKRTQLQMEEDLQLFLGDNTELFVNWLHQVLKKLQEVTVAVPLKIDKEKGKERSGSRDRKSKERRDKTKKNDMYKKSKKKDKDKEHHRKEKKEQKSKKDKKSKSHESIRPNIPPLLMNMERDSEPSITDVFAGQILKNHGVNLGMYKDDAKVVDAKPIVQDKRALGPVIDPASISEPGIEPAERPTAAADARPAPSDDRAKEAAEARAPKRKPADLADSLSDDGDFLNIRTEAEELMNDFADAVPGSGRQSRATFAAIRAKPAAPAPSAEPPRRAGEAAAEALPSIELKLPQRPVRERLGARAAQPPSTRDSFTPEREVDAAARPRSEAPAGEGDAPRPAKVSSRVCASVGRVRPRPRASNLLLRAVADAHRSLLAAPAPAPKADAAPAKRALVLPMRRALDPANIVIRVAADGDAARDVAPPSLRSPPRPAADPLALDAINIHNPTVDRNGDTQFIVTMDGYHPNAFLAKKLKTEGLLDDTETLDTPTDARPAKVDGGPDEKPPACRPPAAPEREQAEPRKRPGERGEGEGAGKRRRASPIVFDVGAPAPRCRAFPACRFGAACAFAHPRCKFEASCTRRGCLFAHRARPCRFFPACANPACAFAHPKPCRFGRACAQRLTCAFYHGDASPPRLQPRPDN